MSRNGFTAVLLIGVADLVASLDAASAQGTPNYDPPASGRDLYLALCARCHGDDGLGLAGPRLAGMTILGDATYLIRQILTGSGGAMPGFRNALSDANIAAVANFLRENWGAALYPAIAPEDVAAERAIVTGR
jgi:mono/diheme cytochrome c family protein